MNAALPIASTRAQPYSATRFEAFRIVGAEQPCGSDGWKQLPPSRTTYGLGEVPATVLDDALSAVIAKGLLFHKDHLAIRETGTRFIKWANKTEEEHYSRVHLYAIKRKSAPVYRWEGHRQIREQRLYAAHLCTIDGAVFA